MKLLAGTHYDPTTAGSVACSSLLAMTAIDTTNLRYTFVVPSNGAVLVRLRVPYSGGASIPSTLLGFLDHTNGDVVKARQAPIMGRVGGSANSNVIGTSSVVVSGLTPGATLSYDAAYGVEFAVASALIRYGGPNDATANNAYGGLDFEIWDTPGLLDAKHYDPATAVANSTATSSAMAALANAAGDSNQLRCTFVGPSGGLVYVRLRGCISDSSGAVMNVLLGILDGATVKFRGRGVGGNTQAGTFATTDYQAYEASGLVAVTPGTTYNWDAAWGTEAQQASSNLRYGGPNNTTQTDAWGGFSFDVWNPDNLPRAIGSVA